MVKSSPKKSVKEPKKPHENTGRPVRAAVQAARAATLKKLEEQGTDANQKPSNTKEGQASSSFSPQHVALETGDMSNDQTSTDADSSEFSENIVVQNVAEAITTENTSEYAVVSKNVSSSRLFLAALGTGIFLGVVIFGGLLLYESYGGNFAKTFSSLSPSPAPTDAPSPTEVVIKPSEYAVQVLNGSGTSGVASSVATLLGGVGFSNTDTGNASSYEYTETEVQMKKSVPSSLFGAIKKSLSGYSVVEVTALPDTSSYDIVVTVGTKTSE